FAASRDASGWIEAVRVDGHASGDHTPEPGRAVMLTLCIRYALDSTKLADFEAYARAVAGPIERCGGKVVGYFAPTKFAGPTNVGLSLIDFPSLAAYERYREALAVDP